MLEFKKKEKLQVTFYFLVSLIVLITPYLINLIYDEPLKKEAFYGCWTDVHNIKLMDGCKDWAYITQGVSKVWYVIGFLVGGIAIWVKWVFGWRSIFSSNKKINKILGAIYLSLLFFYSFLFLLSFIIPVARGFEREIGFYFSSKLELFALFAALYSFDWLSTELSPKKYRTWSFYLYLICVLAPESYRLANWIIGK